MNHNTLSLGLAQLTRCLQKSRFNKYSDSRKEVYQKTLIELFDVLSKEDFTALSEPELIEKKKVIDFIFDSIQYLDNSTLTIIPFEIVYCLEAALNEWIPGNKYIVVTSLSNELLSYKITDTLALDKPIYDLIENEYGKKFDFKLIQITLPRYYVHDYLANVVLYHELGHFIDRNYKISETIVQNQQLAGLLPNDINVLRGKYYHYMEYFADIFAAQYIGEASNYFLNYIAYKQPSSFTHPATDSRIDVVAKFLVSDYTMNEISELVKYTPIRTAKNLEIRFKVIPPDDFINLVPFEIANESELHSIFFAGWQVWNAQPNKLKQQFSNQGTYKIINNLIEKSISNYIVTKNWENAV